jgi:Na+-transporting NADH:ubiquinone oxidoreductase subunit A
MSFSRTFLSYYLSRLMPRRRFEQKASLNGSRRAFIVTGIYEKVLPMDIYPVFLIKSILAEDIEEMEGLGIYEVIEEDFALCEYIDPSKNDFQELLRRGLDLVEREG